MFKTDDNCEFVSVGLDKVRDKWQIINYVKQPIGDYDGWLEFLRSQGHTVTYTDLDAARFLQVPVIAVKQGSTLEESIAGAAWFYAFMTVGS
jgi:hypothetical protein